jgi:hypothetical protein
MTQALSPPVRYQSLALLMALSSTQSSVATLMLRRLQRVRYQSLALLMALSQ